MTRSSRDYTAYGLHIRSPIDLPFAPLPGPPTGEPDVRIFFGETPASLPNPVTQRKPKADWLCRWEAAEDTFLLKVRNIAGYLVTNRRNVTVDPYGGSDHDIGVFLTGRVFTVLLQQHGLTPFHASAIATETGAVLFVGPSGIGKSSILAALLNRGCLMMSDDVTGVKLDATEGLTVPPAFPHIRLRVDTLDMVGWRNGVQTSVWEGSEKHRLPVERFHPSPMPLHAIYILTRDDLQDVSIERLSKSQAFNWLYKGTHRKRILYGLGQQRTHFSTLTAISKGIPAFLVKRPRFPFLLDTLAERIDAHLRGEPLPAGNDAAAGQAVSRSVAVG